MTTNEMKCLNDIHLTYLFDFEIRSPEGAERMNFFFSGRHMYLMDASGGADRLLSCLFQTSSTLPTELPRKSQEEDFSVHRKIGPFVF